VKKRLLKLGLPMIAAMSGVNRPATKASTTAAKVRPMTKATAIWTKLPCITNFLKLDTFQPPPGRTDDECEKAYLAGQPNPISFHGARWALWHNPENLTDRQQDTLEGLARANRPLYRAYLLKEALRLVFHVCKRRALAELRRWILWARRSRLAPLVKLARTITNYRASIEAALRYRLSNALVESTNQKIRLISRRGYGFHSAEAIIALAKLSLGGLCPPLPGRS
jgi:transposase